MKKILGAAVLMAAGAALAATTIESSNTFGFVPATGATGLKAVAVPVAGYGAGDIKIAEVLQTANLAENDKLYTLNANGTYNQYTLNANKVWVPAKVVTVVGGVIEESATDAPEVATVARGKAFWLDTKATQVNILGQASAAAGEISVSTGWNLIGNPSMTTALKVSTITAGKGSRLNVGTTYFQKGTSKWYKLPDYADVTDNDVIEVGQGAMLLKK